MKMDESNFNEKKVGFTLKTIFFSVVIFYITILIWFIGSDYTQTIKKVKDDGLKTSTITSLQVRSTFEQIRNILIIISSELVDDNLTSLRKDGLSKYLYSRNMLISDIEYLLLTDQSGNILASSSDIPYGASLSNADYFTEFKESDSDQLINPQQRKSLISNEWIISFIHKKYDSQKYFSGILEAAVPLNLWYQYFKKQLVFPNDEINIVHLKTCSVLGTSSKNSNDYKSEYISKEFCEKNLTNIKSDSTHSYIDKRTGNAISYVTLPEFKIAIVTISSPTDFLSSFYKKNTILVLVSLIIIFWFWQLIKYQLIIEEKLRQERIQKIQSSKMASLGEMAGGIAHEINTPLAIISMKTEQLKESIEENDFTTEELVSSLKVIKATTERIAKIVSGLRFFARDGSVLPMERTDLDSLIEETFSFCSEKMRLHDVKLEVIKNYQEKNLFLHCRAVEISQVLLNLLNNANDAISGQQDKWINLVINDLENEVEISVIDSGEGIPKEMQDKIMQPFFTTKEIGKGTGLGLSISRGIIDSHRGKFFIDQNSKNTKFTIVLSKIS